MSTVPGSLLGKNKCGQAYARLWLCVCVCFWGCVWLARVCLCVCPVSTHPSVLGGRRQKQKSEWHFRAERPWNQMQSSINSINVQRLLAIKIAQSLLVSGSKMDDQWPWRSQRSKVTVTLKCNLCWSPPWAWPSAPTCRTGQLSALRPAHPGAWRAAFGPQGRGHQAVPTPKPAVPPGRTHMLLYPPLPPRHPTVVESLSRV